MKKGLEYFPMDVDMFQDIRIRKLIKRQSGKAISVYALLLCFIYKDGYYMRWDEELPFIISEQTGFDEAYIREVINCCVAVGLFDESLFRTQKILTSKGIQERYISIIKTLKRVTCITEFNLLSLEEKGKSSEERGKSSEESGKSSEESCKSSEEKGIKGIKEKGKEKKESPYGDKKENAAHAAALFEGRKEDFYNSLIPFVAQYGKGMVREFFDYWTEPNKSHTKMRFELERTWDVARRLSTWASRDNNFNSRNHGTRTIRGDAESRAQDAADIIASLAAEEQ